VKIKGEARSKLFGVQNIVTFRCCLYKHDLLAGYNTWLPSDEVFLAPCAVQYAVVCRFLDPTKLDSKIIIGVAKWGQVPLRCGELLHVSEWSHICFQYESPG